MVDVKTTGEHVNRAADRGCCVSSCSPVFLIGSDLMELFENCYEERPKSHLYSPGT